MTDIADPPLTAPARPDAPVPAQSGAPRDTRAVRPLWRHLVAKPSVVVAAVVFALIVVAVVLADVVSPYTPLQQDLGEVLALPSAAHPLGTDDLGRDVLSRILHGGQGTLLGILQAVVVFVALGVSLGLVAGLNDGWIDRVVDRFAELLLSVPTIIIILVVLTIVPGNMTTAMITAGILASPLLIRLVRGNTKSLREELYVRAAIASGLTRAQVAVRHILPRLTGPILVQATVFAASAIMIETGLGYLGFGTQMPNPSWGNIVKTASNTINQQPWLLVPAGLTIAITVVCLAILGDGLRDAVAERWSGVAPGRRTRAARARTGKGAAQASGGNETRRERPAAAARGERNSGAVLSVRGLTVDVETPSGRAVLVDDVGFDVRPGRTLCLVGESGSGKSVTALALLGLTANRTSPPSTIARIAACAPASSPSSRRTLRRLSIPR
jgi:peptide/nickel transport system permease protein